MSADWRTVRVFISSTFRDMHAERNWLVKRVFPQLRERLEPYRVHLVDVDLRWGVTKEQAEADQTLGVCLEQIEACRPFFLGLLGERYGWISQTAGDAVLSRWGWARDHGGKSITELEILHGVLNNPAMHKFAYFCFRDPAFMNDVPENLRTSLDAENEETRQKLRALKQRIRDNDPPLSILPGYACAYAGVVFNRRLVKMELSEGQQQRLDRVARHGLVTPAKYLELEEDLREVVDRLGTVHLTNLEEFGKNVHDWLWGAVKERLELPDDPGELQGVRGDHPAAEDSYHQRFMESRLQVYVGREKLERDLLEYAGGEGEGLCLVTGPSGMGKSAALARFTVVFDKRNRDAVIIAHFVGASPASADLRQMLRRLCLRIRDEFGFDEDVPQELNDLIRTTRVFLEKVPGDRRLVLVLDGLDQLHESDNVYALRWLPWRLPSNVRLVISCLDEVDRAGRLLRAFAHRPHCRIVVAPLSDAERRGILQEVPSLSAKTLDDVQIGVLLANGATAIPLFLLVALEELRGFGSFEHLDRRIAQFPHPVGCDRDWSDRLAEMRRSAEDLSDAGRREERLSRLEAIERVRAITKPTDDPLTAVFQQVEERLSEEFDDGVLRNTLSFLVTAREGLSQHELLELIDGREMAVGDSVSDLFPVLRQIRTYLQYRGELLRFAHGSLDKAVRKTYQSEAMAEAHRVLGEYFAGFDEPTRHSLVEHPFHLSRLHRLAEPGWAEGDAMEMLSGLFNDLHYLDDRCRLDDVQRLIDDYALLPKDVGGPVRQWPQFLAKHADALNAFDGVLFTVVHHEGFEAARKQAKELADEGWNRPWTSLKPVLPLAGSEPGLDSRQGSQWGAEVVVCHRYGSAVAGAIAPEEGLAFIAAGNGLISMIDLHRGQLLPLSLPVGSGQVVAVAATENADYLAIAFADGSLELHGLSRSGEDTTSFEGRYCIALGYRPTEFETPVIRFVGKELLYQGPDGGIDATTASSPEELSSRVIVPPNAPATGTELSGLAVWDDGLCAVFRSDEQSTCTVLATRDREIQRLEERFADVTATGVTCDGRIVFGLADKRLMVYELAGGRIVSSYGVRLSESPMAMTTVGDRLIWIDRVGRIGSWRGGDEQPVEMEITPALIDALDITESGRGALAFLTRSSGGLLSLEKQASDSRISVEMLCLDPESEVVTAVRNDGGTLKLECSDGVVRHLGAGDDKDRYCARDGEGRVLIVDEDSSIRHIGAGEDEVRCTTSSVVAVSGVAGRASGGFWVVDQCGALYSLFPPEDLGQIAEVGLSEISRSVIHVVSDMVIWWGACLTSETQGHTHAVVVFQPDGENRLRKAMQRCFSPELGRLTALTWDRRRQELVAFWQGSSRSAQSVSTGTLMDYTNHQEVHNPLSGIVTEIIDARYSPDGTSIHALSSHGQLFHLDADSYATRSVVAVSQPIIRLSDETGGRALREDILAAAFGDGTVYRLQYRGRIER